jgi:hypothetical protein
VECASDLHEFRRKKFLAWHFSSDRMLYSKEEVARLEPKFSPDFQVGSKFYLRFWSHQLIFMRRRWIGAWAWVKRRYKSTPSSDWVAVLKMGISGEAMFNFHPHPPTWETYYTNTGALNITIIFQSSILLF